MEVLVLDGKNYVKASKAARDLGYATDYVGQLCRSGQVDAHLIGRTWYVNQEMLSTYKVEKKRTSRVKAREYAKKTIEEHRLKVTEDKNAYKNIDIRYESDSKELIPKTKKLSIKSTPAIDPKTKIEDVSEFEGGNEIVNEGNKVLMSGDLTVVDVTDGPVDLDTVVLTPGRIKRSRKIDIPRRRIEDQSEEIEDNQQSVSAEETTITPIIQPEEEHDSVIQIHTGEIEPVAEQEGTEIANEQVTVLPTFMERLERLNQAEAVNSEPATIPQPSNEAPQTPVIEGHSQVQRVEDSRYTPPPVMDVHSPVQKISRKTSVFPYVLLLLLLCILTIFSTCFSLQLVYNGENPSILEKSILYSASEAWYLMVNLVREVYSSVGS